jgi:arylformamidase
MHRGSAGRSAIVAVIAALVLVACGGDDAIDSARDDARPVATPTTKKPVPPCDPAVRRDVQYATRAGSDARLTALDVYPASTACDGRRAPVVVWVHGGGWVVGDKAGTGAKLDLFRDLGAAVVSVNYRLAPPLGVDAAAGGVQHPAQAEDVAAAVAWVAGHAAAFGADPSRIVLVGHSAGGHLVSLVGADPSYLRAAAVPRGSVRCVVALDTEGYDLPGKVALGGPSEALVRNAFGDDPQVWHDASPLSHAADGAPVQFLVVTRGAARRQAEAVEFVDAVDAARGDAEVVRAPGYSHEDVNRRLGEPGESVVTPPVEGFVRTCTDIR